MQKNSLFKEFDAVSAKEWKHKIQYDLKGKDYASLVTETVEGINVKPFYSLEDIENYSPFTFKDSLDWRIADSITVRNSEEAFEQASKIKRCGAESVVLEIADRTIDLPQLLRRMAALELPVHVNLAFLPEQLNTFKFELPGLERSLFYFHIDPIGHLVRTGNWFGNRNLDLSYVKELQSGLPEKYFGNLLTVEASPYANAGGNIIQQLAYTIAHANEYFHVLQSAKSLGKGLSLCVKIAVGSHYFFEIVKLSVLRTLLRSLASEYGYNIDIHIFAEPSTYTKTLLSPDTNIIRTTTECMAAIFGGADTIFNSASNQLFPDQGKAGNKLALSQLLLLKFESKLFDIPNPCHRSYYLENVAREMADKAWNLFKNIEKGGGLLKQLTEGTVQRKIRETHEKIEVQLRKGEKAVTGVNPYRGATGKVNMGVSPVSKSRGNAQKTLLEPLAVRRMVDSLMKNEFPNE